MNLAPLRDVPAGLLPLPRPLMTGEVLDGAYRLFRAALLRTLPYSGLLVLILDLPTLYSLLYSRASLGLEFVVNHFELLTFGLVFLVTVPLLGAILLRLDAVANGRRPSFRGELARAVRRWFPGILATLAAFLIPVGLMVLGPAFTRGLSSEAVLFLMIPLFWPTALFVTTLPAFWCGERGPLSALGQSLRVSWRRSWRVVGALLAALSVVSVFLVLVSVIVAILGPLLGSADLWLVATVQSLLYLIVGVFGVPFLLAVLLVLHRDLEMRHALRKRRS